MRILHETPRGCGYRKDGGAYLTGEPGTQGSLPTCVEIDPPIAINEEVLPHTRGLYMIDLDSVLTEEDQRLWLIDTSRESLRTRDRLAWEVEQYGMSLDARRRMGICNGMSPTDVEARLAALNLADGVYPSDYILAITKAGKGRRIARETAKMQEARMAKDWRGLLAACWRLVGYDGQKSEVIHDNLKRLMVVIGAMEDAVVF